MTIELLAIAEWFERHREDRCKCQYGPPDVWASHLAELLTALGASASATGAELMHAAKLLAKSLPDDMLESLRQEYGNTNVAVVRHWRDEVLRMIA